ncbi:uncharacterized protein LOC110872499 isoform X2 [Helianthus annuus]|uniref:uncharacterized protein LOC110872499 isoform X2 n=1 Tax=Helianthus annuus TaxID=4232 RepID=UPI000B8F7740|nr:uncharacterized protein LOC110872499 isoform X2 [Helianthus annuus]
MSEKAMLTEEEPLNKNGADNNKGGKLRFITSSGAVIVPDANPFISDKSRRALASLQAYLDAAGHHAPPVLPAAADVASPHLHIGKKEHLRNHRTKNTGVHLQRRCLQKLHH